MWKIVELLKLAAGHHAVYFFKEIMWQTHTINVLKVSLVELDRPWNEAFILSVEKIDKFHVVRVDTVDKTTRNNERVVSLLGRGIAITASPCHRIARFSQRRKWSRLQSAVDTDARYSSFTTTYRKI